MKKALLLLLAGLATTGAVADERFVGKTFSHAWVNNSFPKEWPTPTFQMRFCDEQTLAWSNTTDPKNVTTGVEHYELTSITKDIVQLAWKESPETTNYGVVLTLNFDTSAIYGVLVNIDPTQNFLVSGQFKSMQGLAATAPLQACP